MDTGATITQLDRRIELDSDPETEKIQILIGDTPLPMTEYYGHGWDMAPFREVLGLPMMGILGMQDLQHYRIQIDFDQNELRFLDPQAFERLEAEDTLGESFVMLNRNGITWIQADLTGGDREKTLIDTGYLGTAMLSRNLFREMARGQDPVQNTVVRTRHGETSIPELRMSRARLGNMQYEGLIIGQSSRNMLGLGFLRHHLVTFDFPGQRLYLRKREAAVATEQFDMSGLALLMRKGKIVVHSVRDGGPAAEVGIKAEDQLIAVDGVPVEERTFRQIRQRLIREAGTMIELVLERDGQEYTCRLILTEPH